MNDSELTIVDLPNGAKAYIKPRVSHGDSKKILGVMADASMVNPKTQEMRDIPLSVQLNMTEKALACLLVKITLPDGTIAQDPIAAVDDMNEDDLNVLFDKIDELTAKVFNSKKN